MTEQMDLRNRVKHFVGVPKQVHLTRDFPGEPRHNGFVLGLGRSLVLLQQFHDFYNEGYTAIRLRDITSIRSGKSERFWGRMLRKEGILDSVGIPYKVPLTSIGALLRYFVSTRQNIIVQCESRESEDEDGFHIGRVLSAGADSVKFHYFSATGRWDARSYEIPISAITKVEFDTPYVNTFSKYVR
jgi:hypothetical protein